MKAYSFLALVALCFTTIAGAKSIRPAEVAIKRGALTAIEGTVAYPRPVSLTMNQSVVADEPTSFTLVEDTGIRCIVAPCPSTVVTHFRITDIVPALHNSDVVQYQAIEILKNIPRNVRIAPRHLNVVESSMELVAPGGQGFMRRAFWEVEIYRFETDRKMYQANPVPVRR